MPADSTIYTELTAAERLAEEHAAASAAARAQRAPTDAYNDGLNVVDRMDAGERDTTHNIEAYRANTNEFRTETDSAARNRRLTHTVILAVACLVPVDAFLALSGIARQVLEWISGIVSADGRGLEVIPSWAVISTASIVSLALWALTLGIKVGTSTIQEKARLRIATSPLEIRRLRNKIGLKTAGRVAYLVAFGALLWTVHEDTRRRLEWMRKTMEDMRAQVTADQQSAAAVLGSNSAAPNPALAVGPAPSSEQSTGGAAGAGIGAEAFVLAVLFALHAVVLCVIPSFTPVNPFGPQPFNLRAEEKRLAADQVTKGRMVRELWDQLNDMMPQQRQSRVDAMPARIAEIINKEFGREMIVIARGPAGGAAPQAPAGPENPPQTPLPPTPMAQNLAPTSSHSDDQRIPLRSLDGVL
jgi:hypothetical protein